MSSLRCKMFVEEELKKLGVQNAEVRLGVVELRTEMSKKEYETFEKRLEKAGLEILNGRSSVLVEKIKLIIINIIYQTLEFPNTNFSDFLSRKLGYNYTYLSNTFSRIEGISIKEYLITHKVERIKEFLNYDEMTLTEIADKLDYSSVAHLSNQFKNITGMSPTNFKKQNKFDRQYIENL